MFSFFGSRKKSLENEDSTGDDQASDAASSASDYVFIERRQDLPSYPGNPDIYPTLPYPVAPPSYRQPERANSSGIGGGGGGSTSVSYNVLSGVPFKLSSKVEYDPDSFMSAGVTEIMYQIRNLNMSDLEYDFEVEKSVLREVGQENY